MASTDSTTKPLPPIRAALFDMDGLLIDSEDLYSIVTNKILEKYGRPLLPWSIKAQMQGRPGPTAGAIFHTWAQLPITPEEFMAENAALQREWFPKTQPLPGVPDLLAGLQKAGIKLALATSSHRGNFDLKSSHLPDLFKYFEDQYRVLGDDKRIPPGRGKPAPDIYLVALETLNATLREKGEEELKPEECLVFEDSVPGVESGRRAGMQVVWCPHPELLVEYKGREEEVLAGLTGEHKDEDEAAQAKAPGVVGDGWATLLKSLEGFPYEKFGIQAAEEC